MKTRMEETMKMYPFPLDNLPASDGGKEMTSSDPFPLIPAVFYQGGKGVERKKGERWRRNVICGCLLVWWWWETRRHIFLIIHEEGGSFLGGKEGGGMVDGGGGIYHGRGRKQIKQNMEEEGPDSCEEAAKKRKKKGNFFICFTSHKARKLKENDKESTKNTK